VKTEVLDFRNNRTDGHTYARPRSSAGVLSFCGWATTTYQKIGLSCMSVIFTRLRPANATYKVGEAESEIQSK
jgi:hypothetical protein